MTWELVEVGPNHPCDRCTHPLYRHAGPDRKDFLQHGAHCLLLDCPCDGYFHARNPTTQIPSEVGPEDVIVP
jgi:hypothetical protein